MRPVWTEGLRDRESAFPLDELPYRTYVLLGDSEMTEGSQWEPMQLCRGSPREK